MGFYGMCVCVQYKTEKDGIQETRVEHKVVLASTDDDFDYDAVSMGCLLYTSPSPRDASKSRMPSSA